MTKYGFDYFVKRAQQLLDEAARMGRNLGKANYSQVVQQVQGERGNQVVGDLRRNVLQMFNTAKTLDGKPLEDRNGKPPVGKVTSPDDKSSKWLLLNLLHFDDDVDDVNESGETTNAASSGLTGDARRIIEKHSEMDGVDYGAMVASSGSARLRLAIAFKIKENPEIIFSPEFKDSLLDPEAVANFMNDNIFIKGSGVSKNAAIKRMKALQKFEADAKSKDISDEDLSDTLYNVADISTLSNSLVQDINRAHGYRHGRNVEGSMFNRRKTGEVGAKKEDKEMDVDNKYTENVVLMSAMVKYLKAKSLAVKNVFNKTKQKNPKISDDQIMDSIIDATEDPETGRSWDADYTKMLKNSATGTYDAILSMLSRLDDTGISLSKLVEKLDDFIDKYQQDPTMSNAFELMRIHLINSADFNHKLRQEQKDYYKGFDEDILKVKLDTPEKKDIFDKFYREIYLPKTLAAIERSIDVATGEIANVAAEENRAFDVFKQQKVNKKGMPVDRSQMDMKVDYNSERERLKNTPQEDWTPYDAALAKKLGMIHGSGVSKSEEAKAYQSLLAKTRSDASDKISRLSKESTEPEYSVMNYMTEQVSKDKFRPKGEFKDRGFKKMNYEQWLVINQ